jgi:carbamate kinase
MRIVLALGGNALLKRGETLDAEIQRRNISSAVATAIAPIARRHEVVITHGNGPQIGLLALQSAAYSAVRAYPLDVLGAESEGMIGYLLEAEIAGALPGREIATLLTQVEIDPADPAFRAPSKPIGPLYGEAEARHLEREMSWSMMRDGEMWRRAVPSPDPLRIREINTIKLLLRSGVIVICAGGGGIPVVAAPDHGIRGVEAVIDKDLAAALLAQSLAADALLLLTDVAGVWPRWPSTEGQPLRRTTPLELRTYSFAAGSMGPKVEAACRFVGATGGRTGIGLIAQAEAILAGSAGTIVGPAWRGSRLRMAAAAC